MSLRVPAPKGQFLQCSSKSDLVCTSTQFWFGLPRCHQPNMVAYVRYVPSITLSLTSDLTEWSSVQLSFEKVAGASRESFFFFFFAKLRSDLRIHFSSFGVRVIIDLLNVFEVFLPQLLLYPNAADPLNGAAAALYLRDVATFNKTVQAHVARHASPEALKQEEDSKMDIDDDLSSLGTISDDEVDDLIFE